MTEELSTNLLTAFAGMLLWLFILREGPASGFWRRALFGLVGVALAVPIVGLLAGAADSAWWGVARFGVLLAVSLGMVGVIAARIESVENRLRVIGAAGGSIIALAAVYAVFRFGPDGWFPLYAEMGCRMPC